MQVNNSTTISQTIGDLNTQRLTSDQETRARAVRPKDEQTTARPERLDIDKNVLAQVEQQQSLKATPPNYQAASTGYDQPSRQNQTAVAAYQSVDNQIQREQLKSTFGVDLFA
ncbi:hypothetical protein AAD001_04270 [Colwelliaceae bacterium 6471]